VEYQAKGSKTPATARITSKGQVTIPKPIRDYLDLRTGDELLFVVREGRVHLEPLPRELAPDVMFAALERQGARTLQLDEVRPEYRRQRAQHYTPAEDNEKK